MCGCNSGGASQVGGRRRAVSGKCASSVSELSTLRNRVVTLFNTEKDQAKKEEYKETKTLIDSMISNIYSTGSCTSFAELNTIKNLIDNEYTKRNNIK
jgi:hypothetical protein